ncbi:hypothetical protein THIOM_003406 [Candidatus Thiomargarita nelsonii]|uniref:Uncharacterized protein n=1 Tax=Candidatus Thiomargarita nelsonii TaxID=1003181 RepID=A0A176RYJ0_9GAMM|nr:hypothetical protein THIOM_003406 [Candidatus Thiomargarita nelsonii]
MKNKSNSFINFIKTNGGQKKRSLSDIQKMLCTGKKYNLLLLNKYIFIFFIFTLRV